MEIYSAQQGIPITRIQVRGTYIQWARIQLVRIAMALEGLERPTHILWVDADMEFPENALARLLAWGQPIVGGLYRKKKTPFTPNLTRKEPDGSYDDHALWRDLLAAKRNGNQLFDKFDGLSTGMLLTDIRIYDAIPQPWFWLVDDDPTDNDFVGEDVYFSMKAKEAGIPIKVDIGLELGHVGRMTYWMAPWWDWLEKNLEQEQ
jgi:hypothetical protein